MLVHFFITATTRGDSAWHSRTLHKREDVTELLDVARIRVGGSWDAHAIEAVSLLALDELGEVTVQLRPIAFPTVLALNLFCDQKTAQAWTEDEGDAVDPHAKVSAWLS